MISGVALITVSCVLFVQMGLADAIQEVLRTRLRIVSCPKCVTFWLCFVWTVTHGYGLLLSVAASFIASYCALWLSLFYDALALLYNYVYEQITNPKGPAENAQGSDSPADEEASGDALP